MAPQATQTPQAHRVTVGNAKGGVGKTTVAINIAGALNDRGHDVLFVDADPQGNATEGLDCLDAYDAQPPTILDALLTPADRADASDLIIEHEEMDVLPANVDLLIAERELVVADLMARIQADGDQFDLQPLVDHTKVVTTESVATDNPARQGHAKWLLDDLLDGVDGSYDYVVIDTPPFHGELLDNCLYAGPHLVVPALTETTSQGAIELLFDEIAALERDVNIDVDDVAAVANRIDPSSNEAQKMLDWLEMVFDDVPVFQVRKRVALQYAFDEGVSLFEYSHASDMVDVFRDCAAHLDEYFGVASVQEAIADE